MSALANIPDEVLALADQRDAARAIRDFAEADRLRDRITALGFVVTDAPGGYELAARPPFDVFARAADLVAAELVLPSAPCTVALIVDGWPDDVAVCIRALLAHAPKDLVIVGLDCGDVDGAGMALHELSVENPDRVIDLHVAGDLAKVGWSTAVNALVDVSRSEVVAVIDMSTVLDADAITPILAEFADPTVVASGWRGVNANLTDEWRSFDDAPPGEVDAILGYLLVVRRDAALAAPAHPKARFYRNADIEWSLALRAEGGRLVIPTGDLPLHQERHHGYHDSDPQLRDRESRRTYDRLLHRFRSRPEILSPRTSAP